MRGRAGGTDEIEENRLGWENDLVDKTLAL